MKNIKISGQLLAENKKLQFNENYDDLVTVTRKIDVQVEKTRDSRELISLPELDDNDVIELEFEGGFKRWIRANELSDNVGFVKERGSDSVLISSDSFQNMASSNVQERSIIGTTLKFLKILKIDPVEELANLGVDIITARFEKKRMAQPGLYQYNGKGLENLECCDSIADVDVTQPALLFIHGTFSSSKQGFSDLWNDSNQAYLKQLLKAYGKQVFFLDHFTLSQSPVENALFIAKSFPVGTRFHIVSHSRGGLVGELLCQGRLKRRTKDSGNEYVDTDVIFSEQELLPFKDREKDYTNLKALQHTLQVQEIAVERFVRIAAPARGTLLASNSLEDSINAAYNVLNLIPIPQLVGVADFLKVLLLTLLKKRTDPTELPGIESMMPSSPLIALLNRRSVQLENELTVIAGEVDGTGLITRLKNWISTKIFGEEHDFVVNTSAMYGGCYRVNGSSRYYLDKGNNASHFKYFQHEETLARVKDALTLPLGTMGEFIPLQAEAVDFSNKTRSANNDKHNSLYFIPGVFGSTLSISGSPVWMDLAALQWGDFNKLKLSKAGIKADGLVAEAYDALLSYLAESHNIIPFSYDWRRSHLLAGRKLAEALSDHLDEIENSGTKHTIRLLAHSTGGLVIKALMLENPAVWKRLTAKTDFQVLMLGCPLSGSYRIVQLLAGKHRLTQLMNMLENPEDEMSVAKQLAQYPGILELLPASSRHNYFEPKTWQQLLDDKKKEWAGYNTLESAKNVREQLDNIDISESKICYVAGQGELTPNAHKLDGKELIFGASKSGDGFSLWADLAVSKNRLWFIPAEHGRLVDFSSAFKGFSDLLETGNTQQLSRKLPNVDDDDVLLPLEVPSLYPDEREVLAAALHFPTRLSKREQHSKINISVAHGNLEHVRNAVVVGHYDGDSIVNAEHVLDQRLNGQLRELHRLGMYPGKINTSKILLNKASKPSGAIITGLGEVGKLTAGDLLETYTHALLEYALLMRGQQQNQRKKTPLSISTLLVGSGFGGLQSQDSIMCILRAVERANKALKKNHQGRISEITSIEFVELYEDRAVETIRFLKKIIGQYEYKKSFSLTPYLGSIPGGNRRVMFNEQSGWWQRIQVEGDDNGLLRYVTLTNKARAEAEIQPTQASLVDKYVDVAIKDSHDDREIGKTLFELLVPNTLKDHAHDLDNLVMVLNEKSAGLPWELLQNRLDVGSAPISVRSGMLRQLQTSHYREVVINPGSRTALVVGNPPTQDFSDLTAARDEAKNVSRQLTQQGFEVSSEIGTSARSIMSALHTSDYRVLHLAGHGVFEYDKKGKYPRPVTGMVLGDDIFLTPVEIRQMRKVPEFAFINCCHLGKIDGRDPMESWESRHKLAANLAAELINMGVRAIVAAGWAVNDSAAQLFSETFYQSLLKGGTFGESVILARQHTYAKYKESNTWGAYQCYGDPDYVLTHHAASDSIRVTTDDSTILEFVSENEALLALQNLSSAADSARVSSFSHLQQKLQQIEKAVPIPWLSSAGVRTALGRAHGKLDNFEQSIHHYEEAQKMPLADYPVSMLEDMVSLKTAQALATIEQAAKQVMTEEMISWQDAWVQIINENKEAEKVASSFIANAQSMLDLLDTLGVSIERWEERGKAWKRKAMISKGRVRSAALKKMEVAYGEAHKMALEQCQHVNPYPLVNWQTSKVMRYFRNKNHTLDKSELIYWLNQAVQCAHDNDAEEPSFCSGITLAECTILSYIVESDELSRGEIITKVVDYYAQAIARGAAPRQIRFVSEHLKFLILMLESRKTKSEEIRIIVNVLVKILEMLKGSLD